MVTALFNNNNSKSENTTLPNSTQKVKEQYLGIYYFHTVD